MKRYSTSIIMREMQIKATGRYYYIPNRLGKIKRTVLSVIKDTAQSCQRLLTRE